ncbi:hypothetical protein GJ744_008615 [Endocarpon pusillum]|uniref:Uncharacterized protein n=1 Tax=Endocarpon pusillum TaxID=364733 RepID=A0A8H7AKS4_9EURO|nr:hypothetical protein GJ744_008615 [Endocarpon pusillum]
MPPPNSTAQSPSLSPRTTGRYLHQLDFISSPVPDLAATLTTQADALPSNGTEQPVGEEPEDNRQWRGSDNRLAALGREPGFDSGMSRRIPILREDEGTRYANRVPQRQSLYDWAPGSDDEDLYHELLSRANIPTFAQSVRPQSRQLNLESHRRSHSRSRTHPRDEAAARPASWVETARRGYSPPRGDASIATVALLQSIEQHRRFNARARSTLQSYILDRDRRDNDLTPSASTWARLHRPDQQSPGSPYPAMRNLASQADLRNAYRQLFLENSSLARLKNSIRYLSKLRGCETLEEGLTLATDLAIDNACRARPNRVSERCSKLSDLVVDTSSLPLVAECSWLTPGTVFTGSQHTSRDQPPAILNRNPHHDRDPFFRPDRYHQDPGLALHERQRRRSHTRLGTNTYRDRLPVPVSETSMIVQHGSPATSRPPSINHNQSHVHLPSAPSDNWPVNVTLHDIDHTTQTLSGTMSATQIPSKISPSSPSTSTTQPSQGDASSMRSFFEGEIIDFKIHSLETENFCTGQSAEAEDGCAGGGVSVDARYWRGVGPFRELLEKEKGKRDRSGGAGIAGGKRAGKYPSRDARINEHGDDNDEDVDEDEMEVDEDAVEDALGGEDIIASHLCSRSWIENVLLKEWVLMRWKERCFITDCPPAKGEAADKGVAEEAQGGNPAQPQDRYESRETGQPAAREAVSIVSGDPTTYGLTISGFYYVALRRQTGEIEGLYYDPGSLPFQVLELRPQVPGQWGCAGDGVGIKAKWPALGFR